MDSRGNRQSKNGLYSSSADGRRSSRRGETFTENPVTCRMAVVGDSFTFGEEVAFADSWAYQLEQRLPLGCQVLNFGVRGYGVDQAYLRYLRDVRPWQPHVMIFGFISHDLHRVMPVYGFLLYNNVGTPWAKPRFVYEQDNLILANVPLPKLEEIIAKKSVRELPFITYEKEYRETEWGRPSWRHFYSSYLFRLLTSLHPLWERERQKTSDKNLRAINRELFQSFVKTATSDNTIPLIVYLPYGPDFRKFLGPVRYHWVLKSCRTRSLLTRIVQPVFPHYLLQKGLWTPWEAAHIIHQKEMSRFLSASIRSL